MKALKYLIFIVLFSTFSKISFAQNDSYPRVGFGIGHHHSLYEIGITNGYFLGFSHQKTLPAFAAAMCNFSCELAIKPDLVLGAKLDLSVFLLFLKLGFSPVYYTDFTENAFVLRPTVALTFFGMGDIQYGYNIRMESSPLELNSHVFSICIHIHDFNIWK